ncbi:AMP-binding protein [Paenarthrobacter sp. S56]|uniref:AMP-binding protein n=1 Tax=Paenarthrobacter sp. S56 TaxID=3138179 RepID=UPI00321A5F28
MRADALPEQEPGDLVAAVYAAAERVPDNPAITGPGKTARWPGGRAPLAGKTISYRQLVDGIEATATRLRNDGFGTGERMLFSVRPSPAAFILALGAVRAGGIGCFHRSRDRPFPLPRPGRFGRPPDGPRPSRFFTR